MANIKHIVINGELPFNCCENNDICNYLGIMNGPSFGIKIGWASHLKMVPNTFGGETAIYNFRIEGQEAVSEMFTEKLKQAIESVEFGKINSIYIKDIENNQVLVDKKV